MTLIYPIRPPLIALCFGLLMLAGMAWPGDVWSQGASIEELEQRLQKAKEDRARRDAAAAKANADATRAAAERKAQEARLANLVVQADAACTLSINGKETARLAKGITELKVSPGQKLVSCASTEEELAFEGQVDARSGQDTVLRVELAGRVAGVRSARAADEERAAQSAKARREEAERVEMARQESERKIREEETRSRLAQEEMDGRVQLVSANVLLDKKTGLQWTRSSQSSLTWQKASSYCRGLGGWRLPFVEELKSLIAPGLPGIRCGENSCPVSNRFSLSGWRFWTYGATFSGDGRGRAQTVSLTNGNTSWLPDNSYRPDTICVR